MRGKSVKIAQTAPVAIIFGRERVRLTNDELQKCEIIIFISRPTGIRLAEPGDGGAAGQLWIGWHFLPLE